MEAENGNPSCRLTTYRLTLDRIRTKSCATLYAKRGIMSTENPGDRGTRMDLNPYNIHCEHCWHSYSLKDKGDYAKSYFKHNELLPCRECGNLMDWWKATLKSISNKDNRTSIQEVCLSIEARKSIIQTTLRANQITEVIFADTGIPEDAWILNINYNSTYNGPMTGGSLSAIEIYENPITRRVNPKGAKFFGIPNGDPPFIDANLIISVTWAPNWPGDISWEYLVNAFLYYIDDRYHGSLLAAHSAVEARLHRMIADFLQNVASKDNVKGFLKSRAGYGDQLNVLLPALLSSTKAPKLPDHIRGSLNRVKDLRNDLAHANITTDSISKNDAAEALCAAVFGIRYLDVIEPYLFKRLIKKENKAKKKTPQPASKK